MLVAFTRSVALATLALCATAAVAGAEIYRWEDASGALHLVSDLSDVPAQYRAAALAEARKVAQGAGTLNVISNSEGAPPGEFAVPAEDSETARDAEAAAPESGTEGVAAGSGDDVYTDEDARERASMRQAERDAGDAPLPDAESAGRPGAPAPGEPLPDRGRVPR